MYALESLTPGGSEYHKDVQRCVSHIRERFSRDHRQIVKLALKKKELEEQLKLLQGGDQPKVRP